MAGISILIKLVQYYPYTFLLYANFSFTEVVYFKLFNVQSLIAVVEMNKTIYFALLNPRFCHFHWWKEDMADKYYCYKESLYRLLYHHVSKTYSSGIPCILIIIVLHILRIPCICIHLQCATDANKHITILLTNTGSNLQ